VLEFLLVLVVLALAVWVISGPLRGARETETETPRRRSELDEVEAAKEAKYREIREAELDYRTGKLSEEDWKRIDDALRAEAVEILKRSDELDG
jgi:hypothetical protein